MSESVVIQYPWRLSILMFAELHQDGYTHQTQMVHIDGQLSVEDIDLLEKIMAPDGIIFLDDFEGIAKYLALQLFFGFKNHFLTPPPPIDLLRQVDISDHSTTAMLVIRETIQLNKQ